jgi:uncharacterized FAD-dependent dehydrogenase
VCPVQRVTDFLEKNKKPSLINDFPTSSYRLGVKPSVCHEIYPDFITKVIK